MTIEKNHLINKSLLSFMSPDLATYVLDHSKIISFEQGPFLNETVNVQEHLAFVLSGIIDLTLKNRSIVQSVKAYQFIELSSFINSQTQWSYHWQAKQAGQLLLIERHAFLTALSRQEGLESFYKKISEDNCFEKLLNDFALNKVPKDVCAKIIARASKMNTQVLQSFLNSQAGKSNILIVTQSGQAQVHLNYKDQKGLIETVSSNDYFIALPSYQLTLQSSLDFYVHVVDLFQFDHPAMSGFINNNTFVEKAKRFISNIDQVERQSGSFFTFDTQTNDFDVQQEDDPLDIQDFKPGQAVIQKLHSMKFYSFLQHDAMDCGGACLSMISQFYGKKISIATWRNLVHITREGASMLSLKRAANLVGFDCIGVMSGYKALLNLQVPMIALMQYHFVVVYQFKEDSVTLADPAIGLKTVSKEEFLKEFSNNVLLLKPNAKLKHFPNSKNTFLKYLHLFKNVKINVFEIFLISLLIFIFGLSLPLFSQFLFDFVLKTTSKTILLISLLVFFLVSALHLLCDKLRSNLILRLSSKLDVQLSSLFLNHVLKLPYAYFAVRDVGDILTRLEEIKNIRHFFSTKITVTLINVLSVLVYSVVMYLFNPKLLLVLSPLLPFLFTLLFHSFKILLANLNETFHAQRKNQSLIFEQIKSIEVLQSLNALLPARLMYEHSLEKVLLLKKKFDSMVLKLGAFSTFTQHLMQCLLFAYATYLFIHNELSLGQTVAVSLLASALLTPLIALIHDWDELNKIFLSLEKVDEIFTSPSEDTNPLRTTSSKQDLSGLIQFRDVYFQYGSEHSPMVLKKISFEIPQGKTVAFVGPSGCGKTTLAYMLNQLYRPIKGSIFINHQDISKTPLDVLRSSIALINQDNTLFCASIEENIALGTDEVDQGKIIAAAKLADAHSFIMGKPNGYAFMLGENGEGLSDGQKQRIGIARALYRDPSILILDEATSMLDALSESKIVQNLKSQRNNRTTIIIAHRLNTIMHADIIFVFFKGRLIETGNHQDLLAKRGLYHQMFKRQLSLAG